MLLPEFSLMLPSDNRNRRYGKRGRGISVEFALQQKAISRLAAYIDVGLSCFPKVQISLASGSLSAKPSLIAIIVANFELSEAGSSPLAISL